MAEETIYNSIHTGEQIDSAVAWLLKHAQDHICGGAAPGTTIATPTDPTYWFAGSGTYTCGNGTITIPDGCVGIISYDGSDWSSATFDVGKSIAYLDSMGEELDGSQVYIAPGMVIYDPNQLTIKRCTALDTYENIGCNENVMYCNKVTNILYRWSTRALDMLQVGAAKLNVINDLTTGGESVPLSAEMGKELNERLTEIEESGGGGFRAEFVGTKLVFTNAADLPIIRVSKSSISFGETEQNKSRTDTFIVTGRNLTSGIVLTLVDQSGMFSISQNAISAANANTATTISVTYAPTAIGSHSASINIVSGETTNSIELSGTAVEEIVPDIILNDGAAVNLAAESGGTATKDIQVVAMHLSPNEQVSLYVSGTNDITIAPNVLTADENGSINAIATLTYAAGSADVSGTLTASCSTIAETTIGVTGHVATRLAAGSYWIDGILKYTVLTDTTKVSVKKKDDTTEAPQYITFPASVSDEGMSVFDANGNQVTPSGMTYKLDNVAEAGFRHHASGIVRMVFEAGGVSYINKNAFNRNSYGNGHTDVVFNGYMGLGQYAFYKFNFGKLEMHGSLDQSSSFGSNSFDTLDFYENVSRINLSNFNSFTPTSGAKIIVRRDTMPTMSGTLPSALESVTLYVPADLVSAYQSHAEWGKITNILTIENDL